MKDKKEIEEKGYFYRGLAKKLIYNILLFVFFLGNEDMMKRAGFLSITEADAISRRKRILDSVETGTDVVKDTAEKVAAKLDAAVPSNAFKDRFVAVFRGRKEEIKRYQEACDEVIGLMHLAQDAIVICSQMHKDVADLKAKNLELDKKNLELTNKLQVQDAATQMRIGRLERMFRVQPAMGYGDDGRSIPPQSAPSDEGFSDLIEPECVRTLASHATTQQLADTFVTQFNVCLLEALEQTKKIAKTYSPTVVVKEAIWAAWCTECMQTGDNVQPILESASLECWAQDRPEEFKSFKYTPPTIH